MSCACAGHSPRCGGVYRLLPWLAPAGWTGPPVVDASQLPPGVDYATVLAAVAVAMPEVASLPGTIDIARSALAGPAVLLGRSADLILSSGGGAEEFLVAAALGAPQQEKGACRGDV